LQAKREAAIAKKEEERRIKAEEIKKKKEEAAIKRRDAEGMEKQKASEADAQRKKMEELEQKRAENIKKREAGKGAPAAPKAKERGTKYTKTEVKQLKSIFDEYDKDKMGSINLIEFKEAIRKQGDAQARQEAYEKAQKRGGGKNGAVVAIIPTDQKSGGSSIREQFEGLFSQMDKDGDGEVTFRELLEVLYPLATENEKKIMLDGSSPSRSPSLSPRSRSPRRRSRSCKTSSTSTTRTRIKS